MGRRRGDARATMYDHAVNSKCRGCYITVSPEGSHVTRRNGVGCDSYSSCIFDRNIKWTEFGAFDGTRFLIPIPTEFDTYEPNEDLDD
jgi:hypothetical protein